MSKYTQTEYEDAINAMWDAFHNEKSQPERDKLRHLARELEKKKAVALAEMLLEEDG